MTQDHSAIQQGILFLCVANSARSQMAEGLARSLAPTNVPIFSAGSAPERVRPEAVRVMQEMGVDISAHWSKAVADVPVTRVRTVVTLCDEEVCPDLPNAVERLHWPVQDPAAAAGDEAAVLGSFRAVRDELLGRLHTLFVVGA